MKWVLTRRRRAAFPRVMRIVLTVLPQGFQRSRPSVPARRSQESSDTTKGPILPDRAPLVFPSSRPLVFSYCTALIMSKIGRYIATTIPPTTTPRNTIITGSRSANNPLTAASTSSS